MTIAKIIKNSPWWRERKKTVSIQPNLNVPVYQHEISLDKDVNYFVNKMTSIGIKTILSCGGHGNPDEFYIVFDCPLKTARKIANIGYFTVELASLVWAPTKYYRLSLKYKSEKQKYRLLALASEAWENNA